MLTDNFIFFFARLLDFLHTGYCISLLHPCQEHKWISLAIVSLVQWHIGRCKIYTAVSTFYRKIGSLKWGWIQNKPGKTSSGGCICCSQNLLSAWVVPWHYLKVWEHKNLNNHFTCTVQSHCCPALGELRFHRGMIWRMKLDFRYIYHSTFLLSFPGGDGIILHRENFRLNFEDHCFDHNVLMTVDTYALVL